MPWRWATPARRYPPTDRKSAPKRPARNPGRDVSLPRKRTTQPRTDAGRSARRLPAHPAVCVAGGNLPWKQRATAYRRRAAVSHSAPIDPAIADAKWLPTFPLSQALQSARMRLIWKKAPYAMARRWPRPPLLPGPARLGQGYNPPLRRARPAFPPLEKASCTGRLLAGAPTRPSPGCGWKRSCGRGAAVCRRKATGAARPSLARHIRTRPRRFFF